MAKEIADADLLPERHITDAEAQEYIRYIRSKNGDRGSINELMLLARKDTPALVRFPDPGKPFSVRYLEDNSYAVVWYNPAMQGYQVRLTALGRRYLTTCMTLLDGVMLNAQRQAVAPKRSTITVRREKIGKPAPPPRPRGRMIDVD